MMPPSHVLVGPISLDQQLAGALLLITAAWSFKFQFQIVVKGASD
jgi:hypothetical protein